MRLEQSFRDEAAMGGRPMLGLFRMMAGAAAIIEERSGKKWLADSETFHTLREEWLTLIDRIGPVLPDKWKKLIAQIDRARSELSTQLVRGGDENADVLQGFLRLYGVIQALGRHIDGLDETPDWDRERRYEGQRQAHELFRRIIARQENPDKSEPPGSAVADTSSKSRLPTSPIPDDRNKP